MKIFKLPALILLAFLLVEVISAGNFPVSSGLKYAGKAFDLESGKLYYTEEHEEIRKDITHTFTIISYKNPEGEIIAKKKLDFKTGYLTPSFIQNDFRDGYLEGAEVAGKYVKVMYRKSSKHEMKTTSLEVPPPFVVDGGFNYFVKENWEALIHDKTLNFNFVVPAEQDYFSFRLKKVKETDYKGKQAVIYKMELDNFILRRLVPPIILTYDTDTKRLLKYEGISNINNPKGKSYFVKIVYPKVGP